MATIVTLGSATQDIFLLRPDEHRIKHAMYESMIFVLKRELKMTLRTFAYALGGGAINGAIALPRLGHSVFPCCIIGKDRSSDFIIQKIVHKGGTSTLTIG